ncbi:MAG: FadR family transcriptional regulator [Rhizobiaceae bacterium]|nr:FadR family transcriptional regulator [Rhizobiaceae bacterium]
MARGASGEVRQPDLAPVQGSAVDAVVREIRRLIADEGLKVGDNLPTERELCAQFGASRNTVREAMRILKAYGMVDVRPKIGAIIVDNRLERVFDLFTFNTIEISRKTFSDIQGFRAMVEVDTVERIFDNVGDGDIAELRALNAAMRDAETMAAASEADFAFHVRLVTILGNDAVTEVYRIMKPVIIRIMEKGKVRQDFGSSTYQQHADIVDALEARNRINYQYALQYHLELGFNTFGDPLEE